MFIGKQSADLTRIKNMTLFCRIGEYKNSISNCTKSNWCENWRASFPRGKMLPKESHVRSSTQTKLLRLHEMPFHDSLFRVLMAVAI